MAVTFSSSVNLQGAMQIGMATFTPAALFSTGEQGAWYDPSDNTTMWQNRAGTTPVTGVEQAVGLILDKSKGAPTPGPELITNGDFSGGSTGWTLGSGWSVAAGLADRANTGSSGQLSQSFSPTLDAIYVIQFTISNYVSGTFTPRFGGGSSYSGTARSANGTFTSFLIGQSGNTSVAILASTDAAGTVDNVSLKLLPGNHAYQTSDASRPILRSRYNLLTYSEEFDNAAWVKSNMLAFGSGSVVNATVAPNGTTTADLLTSAVVTAGTGVVSSSISFLTGASYLASFYVKTNGVRYVQMLWAGPISTEFANFDLTTGTVTRVAGGTASITDVGNGWYRISHQTTSATTSSLYGFLLYFVNRADAARAEAFTGDGISGLYVWGAQTVSTAVFPSNTYQRIAASTDYATGAAFPQYLSFDGTDDSLLTASVDFTGTDKMTVWGGVSKLSDAAQAVVSELSATIASNNGTFLLSAPNSAAANYNFSSKGTTQVDNTVTTYAAPITNVVTGQGDISAPSNVIRVNGTQIAAVVTTQGTGNYGNYPLYIGRRNNATLPFNGRLYSLIVRGAATLSSEVASTEQWVAAKTPLGSL